jgi:xylulokinase
VLKYDVQSRINSFAHVNYTEELRRIGILLCINGTGIFNKWMKNILGTNYTYIALNEIAEKVTIGSNGLFALPFGNGAERMLNNKIVGAHFNNLDFNIHGASHLIRAVQEGIAFSFKYGLDIMRTNGVNPTVVRASKANLFLSDVFTQTFANVNNVAVEFYNGDGSYGAAIGAGIGAKIYASPKEAMQHRKPISKIEPQTNLLNQYETLYSQWNKLLQQHFY